MAHPSKIDNLCASLRSYIDLNFRPGAKLPAERVLCKIMGCSSRTLGIAMRKLVEEKRIVRNTKGSFVWSEAFRLKSEEALTLLLPCSDFSFAGNSYSRLGNHLMIRGALTAAKKFQRRIITIPVTDSNDPDDINPMQLAQLGPESMVMFQSRWTVVSAVPGTKMPAGFPQLRAVYTGNDPAGNRLFHDLLPLLHGRIV